MLRLHMELAVAAQGWRGQHLGFAIRRLLLMGQVQCPAVLLML